MIEFHILEPPGIGLVPTWQWLMATWFGMGLVVPLRAGLAVFALLPLLVLAIKLPRLVVPVSGVVIFALGVHVSSAIELATGVKDDRRIVIDEVAAFLIGASMIRQAGWRMLVPFAALFLFLDRVKPWPVAYVEQIPSGWGVMLDDLVPAVAVGLLFAVAQHFWNRQSR
ncbi:MAG: phosphatidylglycerophosphatase A [Agrobacterium albertimagni]|uniref:Phosphatidylglycerophosphatase A n=1 Tax=Agrobacterium albertimagni AOL15 TaxID=1156935 RepID=K2PDT0_9HYPH|nr:phosphatidylglycerophosphatase A [Agrobacterium albertimagni]EKF59083.1 phosphatidylglycerophosphatase A [Agrobacterium albertimagni AOL15]